MWLIAWEFLLVKSELHFSFLHLLSGYYYYDYVVIGVLRPSWFTEILCWIGLLLLSKEVKQLKIIINNIIAYLLCKPGRSWRTSHQLLCTASLLLDFPPTSYSVLASLCLNFHPSSYSVLASLCLNFPPTNYAVLASLCLNFPPSSYSVLASLCLTFPPSSYSVLASLCLNFPPSSYSVLASLCLNFPPSSYSVLASLCLSSQQLLCTGITLP